MRFGKKSRNLAAASRHSNGEHPQQDRQAAGLSVQVLESTEDEERNMTPPQPDESMVAGDPTQRLLTALGRFQRQVTRAEEGAPQESWCDECMNQLIIGIEIALNEDWADVKEALTDAARILQTYEDAGRADQCVRFLKDSYEILCLMVGDLIVGNVRSGVMKKWQERYERALDELAEGGLTLVDDDGPVERDVQHAANDNGTGGDDFDTMLDGDSESTPDSIFDGGPGTSAVRAFSTDPDDPFAPVDPGMEESTGGSPFLSSETHQSTTSDTESLPSLDELLGRPVSPDDDLDDDAQGGSAPELSDDFTAESDEADDSPATGTTAAAEEAMTLDFDSPTPGLETLDEAGAPASEELDFGGAVEPDAQPELEEPAEEESTTDEAAPELELVVEEAPAEAAAEPAPEPEPEPEPEVKAPVEVEPEPGTPEALLRTAQLAMAAGNVADAKLFALQLAANMAKLEADQVEGRIALIEKEIEENSEAITAGELAVNEAEERVRKLEEDKARCQQEFEEKQRHIGALREEVAAVENSVEDLNRQIAELEARRDAEAERLAGCQSNLEDNVTEESRMQAELEGLHDEESGSRENLDGARERVRTLQQSGADHASKLEATQAELEKRRKAVEDIEMTIRHVSDVLESGADQAEQAELPSVEGVAEGGEASGDGPA